MDFDGKVIFHATPLDWRWHHCVIAEVQSNPVHDGWIITSVAIAANLRRIEGCERLFQLVRCLGLSLPDAVRGLGGFGPTNLREMSWDRSVPSLRGKWFVQDGLQLDDRDRVRHQRVFRTDWPSRVMGHGFGHLGQWQSQLVMQSFKSIESER